MLLLLSRKESPTRSFYREDELRHFGDTVKDAIRPPGTSLRLPAGADPRQDQRRSQSVLPAIRISVSNRSPTIQQRVGFKPRWQRAAWAIGEEGLPTTRPTR